VGYDLAGIWCHKAKGNDPSRCTRYNFPLAWYPRRLLEELLGLADWEAVRGCITRLQGSGILRQLVPFGERVSGLCLPALLLTAWFASICLRDAAHQ
jgi:hypothetical protein